MGFSRPLYEGIYNLSGVYFQGTIVSEADKEERDRVQVKIDTMTDQIPDDDLPWYSTALPAANGNTSAGKLGPGTRVLLMLPDGDIYNGIVLFSLAQKAPGGK